MFKLKLVQEMSDQIENWASASFKVLFIFNLFYWVRSGQTPLQLPPRQRGQRQMEERFVSQL